MAINVLQSETRSKSPGTQVTSLQEAVETIRYDALEYARAKFSGPLQGLSSAELLQRHDFFNYFKADLARGIAVTIAAHDESVQEIFIFDPNLNPDAETEEYQKLDPSVELLVLVKSKSAALESFIMALDRAITQQVKALPSTSLPRLNSVLNAILITEEDVAQRKGYAVLLSSLYAKAIRIWQRD